MMWHGYIGIENLALTTAQRAALISALRQLGPESSESPAYLNHRRTRLDGQAAIFEALFAKESLTTSSWKRRLASIFEVDWTGIESSSQTVEGSPVITFSYSGVDYVRAILFGGAEAEWNESGGRCRAYLIANINDWETEL